MLITDTLISQRADVSLPVALLQCTVFVCNDWIRSDQPDVYPSVELIPGRPIPLVLRYRLDVVTADVKGAATTSNVFVEIHGQGGKIGPVQLDNPTAFRKGQVRRIISEMWYAYHMRACSPLEAMIP